MGLVTLQNAHVALVAGKKTTSVQGVELQLTAGLQGKFGPVSFEIDGLGLGANVIPNSKQDLQAIPAGSKPPLFESLIWISPLCRRKASALQLMLPQ